MHVYPRESSIPSESVRASIDTCININLENEREGRKEGEGTRGEGVEDKGSSECVLDPDTSRAPKFSRAIPDATPGDRATHTILPLSSSPTNSTLHVSRKILLKIPRRGKFFSNLSPFHIAYYPRKQISRGSRPTSSFVSSLADRRPSRESVPRFTITKQILISRLPSIVQGRFTPFPPRKATDEMVVEGKIDYPECSEIQKA